MSASYDVAGILPEGMLTELPRGTSVLLCGPPMSGRRAIALEILAAGHEAGDGVLCVTTRDSATRVVDELERKVPPLGRDQIGIVDCSGSTTRETLEDVATLRVSSPADLTGISISTAKLLQRFTEQDVETVRHGLVSVSTLLQYLDVNTVFKFLHVYTARIRDTQGLGVFTIDSASHDQRTLNTLMGEFDGLVELRETDAGERELRVRGFGGTPSGWREF